jgi:succinate-semialdehyde dehydrogenase/glutarate-semialdehyde dehydrogenase
MQRFEMGDPNDPKTVLGPMESVHSRDQIANQVRQSIENGAQVLLGGEAPKRAGAWFPATILTNVLPGQAAHDEELFGPVAAVISSKDERDAIRIVNASEFGLGSAVITADTARGERIACEELDAGAAFVNQNVRSDPRLPFGGVKNSGYGREVSEFGIREFCNIKTVLIEEL